MISRSNTRKNPEHILLIMVDGLGIPPEPLEESMYSECPALLRLIQTHAVPLDAALGVPGIPQSATGQTAILTGVNASQLLGRHVQGFPTADLRGLIEKENLFRKLLNCGRTCTFANAYARGPEQTLPLSLRSVTTVAAFEAFEHPRGRQDMLEGRAVYHDLTRVYLKKREQADEVPEITEQEAATHLLGILRCVDFCLFEFFLTDHAGHRGTPEEKRQVLRSLDKLLAEVGARIDMSSELLLLVSDHGNIEDATSRHHTMNPVPFCAYGCGSGPAMKGMTAINQVTPRILQLLGCTS